MSDQNMDRYLELFLEESTEQIDQLNEGLLRLEQEGATSEIVEDIFRSAHTLKSSAAFVGQNHMSELSHRMEDLLQQVRDNKLGIETSLINLFFRIVDRVKVSLNKISNGDSLTDDFSDLKQEIEAYHPSTKNEIFADDVTDEQLSATNTPANNQSGEITELQNESKTYTIDGNGFIEVTTQMNSQIGQEYNGRSVYTCSVKIDPEAPMKNMKFLLLSEALSRKYEVFASIPDAIQFEGANTYDEFKFILIGDCSQEEVEKECQIDLVIETRVSEYTSHKTAIERRLSDQIDSPKESRIQSKNIKVSADKIDYLMNNVGELVIVNSGLQNVYDDLQQFFGDTSFLTELKGKIDQSERIVRDLQSGIMKTRMMPVGVVFSRFMRPVRDLAKKLNKEVELKFSGEETELDKNILDMLGEPLLHIMRNSLDHGIELPEERIASGKPSFGTLHLQSYQSGNNVFIEIKDDGRGLNRDKILDAAIQKGLVGEDEQLTDNEIYHMIFHPGFSTAGEVTDVSGRGVGMGVVKKMMDEFKGSVQIENQLGKGCSILMSFPLTLAIVSAVIVKLSNEEYAFPLADVIETIQVSRDEITHLQGREIINLRGDILSVYHLSHLMGLPEETIDDDKECPIVIVSSGNRKVGFIVSGLGGKMEIVIKSLEQNFHSVDGLIGVCLLGDGRIVMVVDVHGLLKIDQGKLSLDVSSEQNVFLGAVHNYNAYIEVIKRQGRETGDTVESVLRKKLGAIEGEALQLDSNDDEVRREVREGVRDASLLPSKVIEPQIHNVVQHISESEASPSIASSPQISVGIDIAHQEELLSSLVPQADAFEEISPKDFSKLQDVVKKGMENSGSVLSQLLGVEVKVAIPEFKTIKFKELASQNHGDCFVIQLPIEGDMEGMNLLIFDAKSGMQAAGELMGLPIEEVDQMPLEDIESVLCELSNIVGSGVLNEFSNSTGLTIMPCPPEFYHGEYKQIIAKIEKSQSYKEEMQVLSMMTDFFRDDVEFFGRLYVIPTTKSMAKVLNNL